MAETFQVLHRGILSESERRVLTLLYLPMIKRDAYSLYHYLDSLVDYQKQQSLDYPLSFLYDALHLNQESFLEARKQLEAALLLKTYDANGLTFEVWPPYSADAFFKESPFLPYLKTVLPNVRIQEIKAQLLPKNKPVGKDVSAPFSSVYPSLENPKALPKTSRSVALNIDVDVDDWLSRIPKTILKDDDRTPAFKQNITQLIYIFSLEESDLKTILIDAKDRFNDLSFEALSESASKQFQATAPAIKDAYNLYYFKKRHPVDVLKDITGDNVPKAELALIEKLIREAGLPLEVISVLIAYVISELNGQMPNITYFEKVIGQWHRNKVKDAESAIAVIKQGKAYKATKKASKKPDTDIDWFKDYLSEKETA